MKVKLLSITPNAELLIESAGRTCYKSFYKYEAGAKPSYIRFIRMLLKSGHTSVLEHASATFRIKGGSRSFTHQIVRHRLLSISQQSQRYCREDGFEYITPPSIDTDEKKLVFAIAMNNAQNSYKQLAELGLRKEDARFVLPNACESEIVLTGNFRQWMHVIEMRCDKHAQWEIRAITGEILNLLYKEAPTVFGDLKERFNS